MLRVLLLWHWPVLSVLSVSCLPSCWLVSDQWTWLCTGNNFISQLSLLHLLKHINPSDSPRHHFLYHSEWDHSCAFPASLSKILWWPPVWWPRSHPSFEFTRLPSSLLHFSRLSLPSIHFLVCVKGGTSNIFSQIRVEEMASMTGILAQKSDQKWRQK